MIYNEKDIIEYGWDSRAVIGKKYYYGFSKKGVIESANSTGYPLEMVERHDSEKYEFTLKEDWMRLNVPYLIEAKEQA